MPVRARSLVATLVALGTFVPLCRPAEAQRLIPNQMHTSLVFELHSVRDDIELYEGDPQYLFRIDMRPITAIPPNIDFSVFNQAATLRVRDLWVLASQAAARGAAADEVEEVDDPSIPPPASPGKPVSEGWDIEIAPASPTDFILQCDRGKADLDFTDLPVRNLHLLADTTEVRIEFDRPNSVALERFKVTVREGDIEIRTFLHARAQSATVQIDGSKCRLELTGEAPPGEMDLFIEGVPRELRIAISEAAGLHVEGPAAIVTRFDRKDFVRRDLALEHSDFAERRNRIRIYFSRPVPKLEVEWTE